MAGKKTVRTLTSCINACASGDLVCVNACEADFLSGPGNTVVNASGGKVFRDATGGKVFVNDSGQIGPVPPGF